MKITFLDCGTKKSPYGYYYPPDTFHYSDCQSLANGWTMITSSGRAYEILVVKQGNINKTITILLHELIHVIISFFQISYSRRFELHDRLDKWYKKKWLEKRLISSRPTSPIITKNR